MLNVEIRSKDTAVISGYVNAVERESRTLHRIGGTPFREVVRQGTFKKALQNGNSVELKLNHERTLCDTNSGLELREDNIGLYARAVIVDSEVIAAAQNGKLTGWSFGFKCKKDSWNDTGEVRTLEEIELILDIKYMRLATMLMVNNAAKEDVLKTLKMVKNPLAWQPLYGIIETRYNDDSHYTKDEHGRFTGSTSSGGGAVAETKEQKILKQKIKDGELTKNIYKPKQEIHYRGTHQYEDFAKKHGVEKSYFTVPINELQNILDKKFATGRVHIDRAGTITEIFDCEKEIGFDTLLSQKNTFVKVHYSKNNTHLVPHVINTKSK